MCKKPDVQPNTAYCYYKCRCERCRAWKKANYQQNKEKVKEYGRLFYQRNREKHIQRTKAYKLANPRWARDWQLNHKFKISLEEYNDLLAKQSGLCAVCLKPPKRFKNLSVDHDHTTGKVRGLLCFTCNLALGHLGDNLAGINRVISYLTK